MGPHVSGYEWLEQTIDRPDRLDYVVSLRLILSGAEYQLDRLTVERRPGGPPVGAEALRSIPVGELAGDVMEQGWLTATTRGWALDEDGPTLRARGDQDDDALAAVAITYAEASLQGAPPVDAVALRLGCSKPTASRWIAAARRRGHLPESTRKTT